MYRFRGGVMRSLKAQGYKIYVVSPSDNYTNVLREQGIDFIPIRSLSPTSKNPLKDFQCYREYRTIYKKIKPDLIFHYTIKPNIYGTLAAKEYGFPSICIIPGIGSTLGHGGLISKLVKNLYKLSLKHSYENWVLNKDDQKFLVEEGLIPEENSFVLNSEGVDTDFFSPISPPSQDVKTHTTFLLIARMMRDKGIEEFVEAAKLLKVKGYKISCQLLGRIDEDTTRAIPIEQIRTWEKKAYVNYLGVSEDIRQQIKDADCIVLPSYYREGVPRSLMEGASMGKPLITTDNVGCREVVEDGVTGYLCKVKDVVDLVEKMEQFIHLTPKDKMQMGLKGRNKMIAEFDEKNIIQLYHKKIEEFLGSKTHRESTLQRKSSHTELP